MTVDMRLAFRLAALAMFLNMAFTSTASAQDAMQRDLMFRESLLRKTSPQEQPGLQAGPGMAEPVNVARPSPRRPQRQKP